MSRDEQQRLRDIKDAIVAIRAHLQRADDASPEDRTALLHDALLFDALTDIDIGDIGVRDDDGEREALIANVRLANGAVKQDARQRLMSAFNTPFYPEVLVASSVMAEGVDLHLMWNVIHHDLNWNPSVIEQRTGRLDRIGSKGERARLPVNVYLPFIEGAQDEKQFRVMRDRERWFNVVMGERLELDERSTRASSSRPRRRRRSRWICRSPDRHHGLAERPTRRVG